MMVSENGPEIMEIDDVSNVTICRLCAEMTTAKSFIPLFTDDKKEQNVTMQLNQLVANLVSPNDGLPQDICLNCAEKVTSYYDFVSSIIATQNRLRRLMMLPEIKKMDPIPTQKEVRFLKNVGEPSEDVIKELLTTDGLTGIETTDTQTVFSNVDNFVELFVVHPNEMVGVNLQDILKSQSTINIGENNQAVIISEANERTICIKAEELTEETELIDEEANESDFDTKHVIVEEPVYMDYTDENIIELADEIKEFVVDEYEILYKSGGGGDDCDSAYETNHRPLYQQSIGDVEETAVNNVKKVREFFCNICNRLFKSELVFRLHVSHHKRSTLCRTCNACFLNSDALIKHVNEKHPNELIKVVEEPVSDSEIQCDTCGKITDNLKQHKMFHAITELEYCKEESKKHMKKWFYCEVCNKKIFSEGNFLFHVARHQGANTVRCKHCDCIASNIQEYNMHITTHTGGKYFICNDCDKCFFTRSAISDHVLLHMEGTRYMCEICGKRFKTSRSNAQHKLLQHKKYFRCNRCNRGFTREDKLNSHFNICQAINTKQNDSKVFEPVERFFCNICNSNIKSTSEISILFHKAKHEGKDGVECKFCHLICKNACMYKNHLLIHTNQRPYSCNQCTKSFRTKGCLVQHMLVHGDEYKYTCKFCGKKSKKLTTHVNHVNIHTNTKPYKCPDCDRPFRQLSDMKKHRRTHLKYKPESITISELPSYVIKTEVHDLMSTENIQQLQQLA